MTDIELVDFITVGTVGEKGNRTFHLQARDNDTLYTFIFEKQQASALAEGIDTLLDEVEEEFGRETPDTDYAEQDMMLDEPLNTRFRVAQIRLEYDNSLDRMRLTVTELTPDAELDSAETVRMGASREQMRQLAEHTRVVVSRGRAKPEQNGYRMHY